MRRSAFMVAATAAFLGFGLPQATFAADLAVKAPPAPVVVVPSWTGFYIGIDGGFARAHYSHDFNTAGHYNFFPGDTFDYNDSGGMLGGHFGYNWQVNQWVFGIEGSIAKPWVNSNNNISPFFPASDVWTSKVKWIATITPRLGYAAGNALFYVKGGWAYARTNDYVQDFVDYVDASLDQSGWTAGVGIEYLFAHNWIVGFEYNHYDFGKDNITASSIPLGGGAPFAFGTNHDFGVTVDSVLARISYKFGGPVAANY